MKVFNNKYYIIGLISLLLMGGVVIYTFRTIFSSLSLAFEVDTEIPESELRVNRQNLDKAYDLVFESQPTSIDLGLIGSSGLPQTVDDQEGEVVETDGEAVVE